MCSPPGALRHRFVGAGLADQMSFQLYVELPDAAGLGRDRSAAAPFVTLCVSVGWRRHLRSAELGWARRRYFCTDFLCSRMSCGAARLGTGCVSRSRCDGGECKYR